MYIIWIKVQFHFTFVEKTFTMARKTKNNRLSVKHRKFINEMIEHGDPQDAYKKVYPAVTDKSASNLASELLKKPEIWEPIDSALNNAQKEAEESLTRSVKEKLENFRGVRDILATIISGEYKFEKLYKTEDGVQTFQHKGGEYAVMRALDLNLKHGTDLSPSEKKVLKRITVCGIEVP
jgi:hypothetical protein